MVKLTDIAASMASKLGISKAEADKFVASMQIEVIILQFTQANLWTLQILQNCNVFTALGSIFANRSNLLVALLMLTMAKISRTITVMIRATRVIPRWVFLFSIGSPSGSAPADFILCLSFCKFVFIFKFPP